MDSKHLQGQSKGQRRPGILPPEPVTSAALFHPAAAEASQHLAAQVLGRYGLVPAEDAWLEPVHLRPPAGQVLLQTTRRYTLHLSPQIRLAFVRGAARPAGEAARSAIDGSSADMRGTESSSDRQAERRVWVETLVERLFARGERLSSIPGAEPTSSGTLARNPSGAEAPTTTASRLTELGDQPLQKVLRKPASALAPSAAQTSKEAQTEAVQVTGAQWARTALPHSMAPPPIDIQQITQQVIQTIDRKIIGQRERFGRI